MSSTLSFLLGSSFKRPRLPSKQELDELLPLVKPNWEEINKPDPAKINVTWIGHASFLVQFGGVNILTDPVFSDRASPVSFGGPWRYRPLPLKLSALPKIDLVVISHSHYDHLDLYTVLELNRHRGGTHFLVGLGSKAWFEAEGITAVTELDWWQHAPPTASPAMQVTCLPVKHWSMRRPGDRNKALWCSWAFKSSSGQSVYFTGDSAMCPVFADIGHALGPFDLALIPIGAFKPQAFLRTHHMSPTEAVSNPPPSPQSTCHVRPHCRPSQGRTARIMQVARSRYCLGVSSVSDCDRPGPGCLADWHCQVQVHVDLGSVCSVGCHWGTFRQMAHEHVMDPKRELEAERDRRGIPAHAFRTLHHGQTLILPSHTPFSAAV